MSPTAPDSNVSRRPSRLLFDLATSCRPGMRLWRSWPALPPSRRGHVFGIDATAMLEVARETFARAGLAERSRFIRGRSLRVELPEEVDLVICDHVGYFGFDYGIVETLQDARRRFPQTRRSPDSRANPVAARCDRVGDARATKPMAGRRRAYPRSSIGCASTRST